MTDDKELKEILKCLAEKFIKDPKQALKCLAEKFIKDPKQALKWHTLGCYLLKGWKNKAFRALLANPKGFISEDPDNDKVIKAINEWIWESFINSKLQIIRNLPNRSQVIEFLEFEYKASPDDETESEEFIRWFINKSIQNAEKLSGKGKRIAIDKTENEKFLRRFLNKSIQVARDHWENFGDFEMETPETSAFKKYENLIRGYLFVLGVFTPDPYSQYMSDYMNKYEAQKAEAFRTMDENPSFSWEDFADFSPYVPLDIEAAIFSAEIDPEVWRKRIKTIRLQKSIEGWRRGGGATGPKKGEGPREKWRKTQNRLFKIGKAIIKRHPVISALLEAKCEEEFLKLGYSKDTFDRHWPEVEIKLENWRRNKKGRPGNH